MQAIQKAGMKARIPPGEKFSVETFKEGAWHKAIEVKGIGVGDAEATMPEQAFGYSTDVTWKPIRISGFKVSSLARESLGKLSGALKIKGKASVGVEHVGRLKDVPDYSRILATQARSTTKPTPAVSRFLKTTRRMGVQLIEGDIMLPVKGFSKGVRFGKGFVPVGLPKSPSPYASPSSLPSVMAPSAFFPPPSVIVPPPSASPFSSLPVLSPTIPSPPSYKPPSPSPPFIPSRGGSVSRPSPPPSPPYTPPPSPPNLTKHEAS